MNFQSIEPGDKATVVNQEYHCTLTYKDAVRKDSGIYTITVTNEHGSDTADIDVVVLGMLLNTSIHTVKCLRLKL